MLSAAGPAFPAKDIGADLKAQIPQDHGVVR